jgi:hypothetical protein
MTGEKTRAAAALLLSIAITLPATSSAFAQTKSASKKTATQPAATAAPTRAQVIKFFQVLEMDKQMDSMRATMRQVIQQQFDQASMEGLSAKQRSQINNLQNELYDRVMGGDYIQQIMDGLVPLYQRHFTAADLDTVMRFYSTPAGQKFLHESPQITTEYMPRMMEQMPVRLQEAMQAMNFDARMRKILSESYPNPASPKP